MLKCIFKVVGHFGLCQILNILFPKFTITFKLSHIISASYLAVLSSFILVWHIYFNFSFVQDWFKLIHYNINMFHWKCHSQYKCRKLRYNCNFFSDCHFSCDGKVYTSFFYVVIVQITLKFLNFFYLLYSLS